MQIFSCDVFAKINSLRKKASDWHRCLKSFGLEIQATGFCTQIIEQKRRYDIGQFELLKKYIVCQEHLQALVKPNQNNIVSYQDC